MPVLSTLGGASAFGFGLNRLAAAIGATTDEFFANTVLLLSGDGTSGAQNNTFLDSSTNNHTITRNGNVTQGSFSPFAKADGKWGNSFDRSGDYVNVANSTDFAMGTGDFTIEGWVYFNSFHNAGLFHIDSSHQSTSIGGIAVGTNISPYDWRVYYGTTGANSATVIIPHQWQHFAYVRYSGTTKLYVDGAEVFSVADTTNYTDQYLFFGGYYSTGYLLDGYLSNLRVVKGTAVYTSAFTPSTTPLTAISGTSLLTCQSNRFVDNSTNGFALTVNGDVKVTTFSPFAETTEYTPATRGGSGYFDGTGDYLSVANQYNLSSDFTIETWVYRTDNSSFQGIFSNGDYDSTSQIVFIVSTNTPQLYVGDGSGWSTVSPLSSTIDIGMYQWHHLALTCSSNTFKIWVDGVEGASTTYTGGRVTPSNVGIIGRLYPSTDNYYLSGYLSDYRVTEGTAVYTSAFTPPTAPLNPVSGASLLCNFTNAGITDLTGSNVLETVGNAQVDTTTVKYGTGAMEFDGTGDWLLIPNSEQLTFGTGDFTVEFWLYTNSTGSQMIYDGRPDGVINTTAPTIYLNSGTLSYYVSGSAKITGASLSTGTWYHIAVSRSGTSTKMFVNGTQSGSTYSDSTNYTLGSNRPIIGTAGNSAGALNFNGYLDDFRITKGIARYTANFTPPTAALLSVGQ